MTGTEARMRWKQQKFEVEGLCLNCCKRPAGGDSGTLTACSECAQRKRDNAVARTRRLALRRGPKIPKPAKLKPVELSKAKRCVRHRGEVQEVEPNIDRMLALADRLTDLERLMQRGNGRA